MKYLLLIALIIGCVTFKNQSKSRVVMQTGDEPASNVLILENKKQFLIKGIFTPAPYLISIYNCHRKDVIFTEVSDFDYLYEPNRIEKSGCPLIVAGFVDNGVVVKGVIDFRSENPLAAKLDCNGEKLEYKFGTSACISQPGLVQTIEFKDKVEPISLGGCPDPTTTDGKTFQVELAEDTCMYLFTRRNQQHRLTTVPEGLL